MNSLKNNASYKFQSLNNVYYYESRKQDIKKQFYRMHVSKFNEIELQIEN